MIAGLGLLLIWMAILYRIGLKGASGDLRSPDLLAPSTPDRIGYNWSVRGLDGRQIPFDRYRGKAILLNFWAPWCGPCLEEMPAIDRLAANPRLKDVAVLCVSTEDNPAGIAEVGKRLKVHVPLLRPEGAEALVPFSTGTRPIAALPTTFLIAPDGRIASVQEGAAQWDDPSVVDVLERLAAERETGR